MGIINNNLPAIPEHFTGRQSDIDLIIKKLLERRLVTIKGTPGIGKTGLAIKIGHIILEKSFFKDGVYFISFRGLQSEDSIRFGVSQALGIEVENSKNLFQCIKPHSYLLIFDNCETPLHHIPVKFRQFISNLLTHSPNTKVLITSRQSIGGGLTGVSEYIHSLVSLKQEEAVQLFIDIAPRVIEPIELGIEDKEQVNVKLAVHPILQFLSGHPHAIMLAAPLLQDKTLEQLHYLLEEYKVKALQVFDIPEDEHDETTSFVVSLNISIDYIKEKCVDAIKLFSLMGLLPGKSLNVDIKEIFGDHWQPLMDRLVRASLIERRLQNGFEYFFSYPFITNAAYNLLDKNELKHFAILISDYFAKMIGGLSIELFYTHSIVTKMIFNLEEDNFWACLDESRPYRSKMVTEEQHPIGMISFYLVKILHNFHRYDDGFQVVEIGLKLCAKIKDNHSIAHLIKRQGLLYTFTDNLPKAEIALKKALTLYQDLELPLSIVSTYRALGDMYLRFDQLTTAEEHYLQALTYFDDQKISPNEELETLANVYFGLGKLNIRKGNLLDAEVYFSKANNIFKLNNNAVNQGSVFFHLGEIKQRQGHIVEAKEYFRQSLVIHQATSNNLGQANTLLYHGALKNSLNEESAKSDIEESLAISRKYKYNIGIANALIELANICIRKGQSAEAENYLNEGIEICLLINYSIGEANAKSRLAEISIEKQDFINARTHLDSALSIFQQCKDQLGEANCYLKFGKLLYIHEQYNDAIREYLKALESYSKEGLVSDIIGVLKWIVLALKDLGRYEEAIIIAEEILTLQTNFNDKGMQAEILSIEVNILYAMGNKIAGAGAICQAKELDTYAIPEIALIIAGNYDLLVNSFTLERVESMSKDLIVKKQQFIDFTKERLSEAHFIKYIRSFIPIDY